ncbi:MAG TPA: DUF4147 domain-containing protein, partial [Ignisphaera sp.]|nr:DUF4147 domain-containing protein [Ignisphaera sp.]
MLSSFIKNRKDLERSEIHSYALDIVEEGLRSADPKEAIKKSVYLLNNSKLCVNNKVIEIDGRIHVVGFGKASKRMAEGIYEVLNDKIVGGVVITPQDYGVLGSIQIVKGDHPIPKENTLNASKKLIEYLMNNVRENDVVFVLISGGGSALFEVPADGISIDDIAIVSRELMKRGADIVELNAVRKHL